MVGSDLGQAVSGHLWRSKCSHVGSKVVLWRVGIFDHTYNPLLRVFHAYFRTLAIVYRNLSCEVHGAWTERGAVGCSTAVAWCTAGRRESPLSGVTGPIGNEEGMIDIGQSYA